MSDSQPPTCPQMGQIRAVSNENTKRVSHYGKMKTTALERKFDGGNGER
jgi:hypothetical protein